MADRCSKVASEDAISPMTIIEVPNSCGPIKANHSTIPLLAIQKKLMNTKSEGDQCGRSPDPGKHGSVVSKPRSVNRELDFSVGHIGFLLSKIVHNDNVDPPTNITARIHCAAKCGSARNASKRQRRRNIVRSRVADRNQRQCQAHQQSRYRNSQAPASGRKHH